MSIGANLAEGCGRQTMPELARYVRTAMGSPSELDCHRLLALDFEFLKTDEHRDFSEEIDQNQKNAHSVAFAT